MTDDRDDRTIPSSDETIAAGPRTGSRDLPESIGPYRIVSRLGEGGMGIVFEAEQKSPRRTVALKVVRGGTFADDLRLKLFEREAETLGRLRHPNIAAIHESGRTDDGHHYLVMELVEGDTLDVWRLHHPEADLRTRLLLFQKIADAVHYAHLRGVIHRDLKPANVKVPPPSPESGESAIDVKVLDFGLARLVDREGDDTMLSMPGVVRGTLAYMSPEQARGEILEVDVRSDVYSLGVLLYELLSGRLPYDTRQSSLMESVRVICETRPSALTLEGGGRPDADLELIVAKALAKAPEERYSSVAALSEDLGRFLAGEAILARPPSTMYQLQKLVKRHRPAFAAAGAAVVLLVAFGVAMATLYSRSERNLARALKAEAEAVSAEAEARAEATKARQTKDFLVRTFKVADPERSRGREITAREILTSGAEEVRQDTDLDPATRAELLDTIGTVHRQLGQNPEALALHEEGREVLRKAFGAESPQLASSELSLAHDLDNLGRYDEAIDAARAGIARLETLPPDERPEKLADLHVALANALTEVGRMDEAQTAYELALAEVRRTHGDRSVEAALVLDNFGGSIIRRDPQRAKACLAEALSIREGVLPPDHPLLGFSYSNLSNLQSRLGEREAAVENAEKAFAIWEKCYPPEHPKIAEGLGNLAATYAESGRLEEAIDPMERCLALQEKLYGPMNPLVGRGYNNLALLQLQLGHVEPAAKYAQRSLEVALASGDGESPAASFAYYRIGEVAFERERWAEAKTAFEKSLAIDEKTLGPESDDVAGTSETLAEVLRKLGDERGAEKYVARAKVIRDKQAAAAAAAERAPEEGTGS